MESVELSVKLSLNGNKIALSFIFNKYYNIN